MLNALPSLKASVKKYVVFVLVLVCVVMAFEGHASDESKNMLHSDFDTAMEIALLIRLQYVDPVRSLTRCLLTWRPILSRHARESQRSKHS